MSEALSENMPLTKKYIYDYFKNAVEENKEAKVGIEVEKIGLNAKTGKSAKYTGSKGYLAILGKMYEELGWEITKQSGKFILQMQRGGTVLNLESDGRIELAGSPQQSIHDLAREFRIHQKEINEISNIFGIVWLGIGYHPVSKNIELEPLKGERKELMTEFFENIKQAKGNDFGLAWFNKTAGIHANIDYFSQEDFALKAKVFFRLAPVLNAMFANSPFSKERFTGYMSYRSHVTLNSGIARFLTPKKLYESDFAFEDWIDHILSLPVLFLQKKDKWIKPNMSFHEYIENGYQDYEATIDDFDMHTKSVWMDIKLKKVIELRFFDSLPPSLVPSVAALIKGLAYDNDALKALEKLTATWSFYEYGELQQDTAKNALEANIQGRKVLDLAKEIINIAETSLKKDRIVDTYGDDESKFLEPIKEYIFVREKSPAQWLVHQWEGEWRKSFFPVYDWCQY